MNQFPTLDGQGFIPPEVLTFPMPPNPMMATVDMMEEASERTARSE